MSGATTGDRSLMDDDRIHRIKVEYTALRDSLRSGDQNYAAGWDRCDALRRRAEAIGVDIPEIVEVSDVIGELAEVFEQAEVEVEQGATEYYGSMAQHRLDQVILAAERLGLDMAGPRRVSRALAIDLTRGELRRALFDLDHGERPPQQEWRWDDYEGLVERSHELGIDASELVAALARARAVERCGCRDDGGEDESLEDARPDALALAAGAERPDEGAHLAAQLRELAKQDVGDSRDTLRRIVWAILHLDDNQRVRLEGSQLVLVEHLLACGVLDRRPSERAARGAIRKLRGCSALVEIRSRTTSIYHLDRLRSPAVEFQVRW